MARRDAYLEHLASVPLFAALSKKELTKVARLTTELHLKAGTEVVREGEPGREAFIIVSGTAAVKRNGRRIATLGPGDAFGELALLDHGPRTATVVADTDLEVLVLNAGEFAGLLDEVPAVARKLLRTLATRVRELDRKLYG